MTTPALPSAPAVVTTPSPANGFQYAVLSAGNLTLKWAAGANTTKYELSVKTDPKQSLYLVSEITASASPSYLLPALTDGATYYWRVDAVNSKGTATGTVWSFRTYPVFAKGLVGYWSFDETDNLEVIDSSQYHDNGVIGLDDDNSIRVLRQAR